MTNRARAEVSFALSWGSEARVGACVSEAALREAVEEKLGRTPFVDHGQAQIFIEGEEISTGRDRFYARVTERDRQGMVLGVREVETQSCPSLQRAATLIVSLIIDPYLHGKRVDADEAQPAPPTANARAAVTPPAPTRPPIGSQTRVRVPRPRRLAFDLLLGLGAGTTIGMLPSASATAYVLARLEPAKSRWSFDWRGGYSLSQRLRDGSVLGDFSAVEQHVRSCFAFVRWPSRKLDACGGLTAAAVIPATAGVRSSSDRWRVVVGPTAAIAFDQRVGTVFGRIEFGVTFPAQAYSFSYFDPSNQRKSFYSSEAVLFFITLSGGGTIS